MIRRLGVSVLAAALLLLSGCDTGTRQRLNCICLIDYSGSLSEQTLHRYVELISSEVLHRLDQSDRLVVLPIDEGAKTKAVKLVYDDFAEHQFTYHTDGYAHAEDSLTKRLKLYADRMEPQIASELLRQKELRAKYTYFTDIFSALEQAGALVEREEQESFWEGLRRFIAGRKRIAPTNVIMIFSDMIQESSDCSFAGEYGCTPDSVQIILDHLRAMHRIPDLHGCIVFVNGRTGKTNTQVENIQSFLAQYFKESGADLRAYDYDAGPQITSYLGERLLAAR